MPPLLASESNNLYENLYMQSTTNNANLFDISVFVRASWRGKWWIVAITLVFVLFSVVYALSLPNIYRAEIVAAPSEEAQGGGLGQVAGQLGGLASLAGMNFGKGQVDKATQALEILRSRQFLSDFINRHELAVPLMAAKGWDAEKNELIIDDDIYSLRSQEWVRKGRTKQPTAWEMTNVFRNKILNVQQDTRTGITNISVEFYSPGLAQQWVTALLADLNDIMRQRDVTEAEQSIRYLEERSLTTPLASMQQMFAQLIEKQMQTVMLANVRDEYIYTTLDPALVPETKAKPKRAVIVIIFTMLGGVLGTVVALGRYYCLQKSQ